MINGSCLCQQCSYEAGGELYDVLHCHCTTCRKLHGSAFASYGGVNRQNFKWLSGEDKIKTFLSSKQVERYFCSDCGSLLATIDASEANTIYLSLGAIDTEIEIKPEYHQFVGAKAPWHVISDDLPKYDGAYSE